MRQDDHIPEPVDVRWRRLTVRGRVQGVGFRPAIWRRARALGLAGSVCNTAREVVIEIGGTPEWVAEFESTLRDHLPPRAEIDALDAVDIPPRQWSPFEIADSEGAASSEPSISPDLATCQDCLREMRDPSDRRHGYAFLACTQCGPRYTVIESMPYDRERTTLRRFPLCPDCAREYHDSPANRRFHAEATVCPVCGPSLVFMEGTLTPQPPLPQRGEGETGRGAEKIGNTVSLLRGGKVVAVKSIGGYHLACDAANAEAVALLRERKGRPHKPFALMMADVETVRRHCEVTEDEATLLQGPDAPIVLLQRRSDCALPNELAPLNARLGVMLPCAPLHHLLMEHFEALVMTSGNLSDEPLVSDESELGRLLPKIADAALSHNRPIAMACDDSIAAVLCEHPVSLRRARGHVPRPVIIDADLPELLALGSDLKNTFALGRGANVYLSPHIGDLQNAPNARRAQETVRTWCEWLGFDPTVVVHDLHPQMVSTAEAKRWPAAERIAVQHHHAHLASCLADCGAEAPAIGVTWDGTGYGTDGTIWGGEFLLATPDGEFERLAHLETFPLPGGDLAIRQPWRIACGALAGLLGEAAARAALEPMIPDWEQQFQRVGQWTEEPVAQSANQIFSDSTFKWLMTQLGAHPERAVATSSAGRLFDAVGVLCGLGPAASFEGHHAIALEGMCQGEAEPWPFEIDRSARPWRIQTGPILEALLRERDEGVDSARLATRFHATLAALIVEVVCPIRERWGMMPVALSGGCFQNARLLTGAVEGLRRCGIEVLHHRRVPPNDGGIALGQAVIAAQRLARR